MNPANLLLGFLEKVVHPGLKTVGIDMDAIQMNVYKNTPELTFIQCNLVVIVAAIIWYLVLAFLDHALIRPFMHAFRKKIPCLEYWHKFDEK